MSMPSFQSATAYAPTVRGKQNNYNINKLKLKYLESFNLKLYNLIGNVRILNIIVCIIFFFVWCNLAIEILILLPVVLFWLIGFGLPIILLIGVVQYKNTIAYNIVVSIFLVCITINLLSFPYYIEESWNEYNGKHVMCSCCPLCEIRDRLLMISISFVAISVMHNKRMVETYKWNAILFYKTMIFVCLIFLIIYIVSWLIA